PRRAGPARALTEEDGPAAAPSVGPAGSLPAGLSHRQARSSLPGETTMTASATEQIDPHSPAAASGSDRPAPALRQSEAERRFRERVRRFAFQDRLFAGVTFTFAALVLLAMAALLVALVIEAWPALREFGPGFLWGTTWSPARDRYGAMIAIYGTLVTSAIALLIAVPISFGIAVFLTELCPLRLRRPLGTAVELLAGVPSIIYGIWGLFVFAPVL